MKRVAVLRGYPKDAAYQRVLRALLPEYEVHCFTWDRQGDFCPAMEHERLHYHVFGLRAGYHNLSTLLKVALFNFWLFWRLLCIRVDCIHAIDLDTGFVAMVSAKITRAKFVYHCLDSYATVLPAHWPKFLASVAMVIESKVISIADLFVITDLLRLPQHEGAVPRRLVEFANVPHFDVSLLPRTKHKDFVVGYIGSLGEGRNLLTLIDAVADLADKNVRLIIGGFGPLAERIRNRADDSGNITFVPWVPYERLLELEADFDLFVLVLDTQVKSVRWGSANPNKLFESMAFSRPIVVGAGTLTEERVREFDNGMAIPYGDKDALKEAILFFCDHHEVSRVLGMNGRRAFERNWTPDTMAARLVDAYSGLWRRSLSQVQK